MCSVVVPQFNGTVSLELKVNKSQNAMWWIVNDMSHDDDCPKKCLWMTSFNQRIAPSSVLSMATSYGYEVVSYLNITMGMMIMTDSR